MNIKEFDYEIHNRQTSPIGTIKAMYIRKMFKDSEFPICRITEGISLTNKIPWSKLRVQILDNIDEHGFNLIVHHEGDDGISIVFKDDDYLYMFGHDIRYGGTELNIWTTDRKDGQKKLESAKGIFPSQVKDKDRSKIKFLYICNYNINSFTKSIECPKWDDIRDNYPNNYEDIDWLMEMDDPHEVGKLIFWRGAPGTGKTTAIRSLIRKWYSYSISIISDPDAMLGKSNNLIQLGNKIGSSGKDNDGELIIIEDAADLVMSESRKSKSSSMARLLNFSDGLLGQGLNIVILITTNEPINDVDKAFTRPGRSLQMLTFDKFTKKQANEWLENRDVDERVDGPATLADLYAKLNDHDMQDEDDGRFGFGVGV